MIIKNGLVFGEDCKFAPGEVNISGEFFTGRAESTDSQEVIDAQGCYVIPGLTDIHVHGCHNKDFCDADVDAIGDFASYEASKGITAICPTTMTIPQERLLHIAEVAGEYCDLTQQHKRNADTGQFLRESIWKALLFQKRKKVLRKLQISENPILISFAVCRKNREKELYWWILHRKLKEQKN